MSFLFLRYIICQGLRPGSHTICDYMSEVNEFSISQVYNLSGSASGLTYDL